jgi:hypothetical protein
VYGIEGYRNAALGWQIRLEWCEREGELMVSVVRPLIAAAFSGLIGVSVMPADANYEAGIAALRAMGYDSAAVLPDYSCTGTIREAVASARLSSLEFQGEGLRGRPPAMEI